MLKTQRQMSIFELEDMAKYQANVQLVFEGNLAGIAGDALYGGRIDICTLFPNTSLAKQKFFYGCGLHAGKYTSNCTRSSRCV